MNGFMLALQRWTDYAGRSRRGEYLAFHLVAVSALLAVTVCASFIDLLMLQAIVSGITLIAALALMVPQLALVVRRFHDIGRSGWYALGLIVPFYGFYLALLLLFKRGQPGSNAYGRDPLDATGAERARPVPRDTSHQPV